MAARCGDGVSWREIVRRLWKTPYRTHNSLVTVHLINNCGSMDCIYWKRDVYNFSGTYSIVTMYYVLELLDIPCITVTPLLVKMLGILCINIRLSMMIDLMIFSNIFNKIDNKIQNNTQ